jgi:hypothetical protein
MMKRWKSGGSNGGISDDRCDDDDKNEVGVMMRGGYRLLQVPPGVDRGTKALRKTETSLFKTLEGPTQNRNITA